jgi:hypothetical protein
VPFLRATKEEVLALQYECINRGDFEKAYSLFAEQSRREVSSEQYRVFFEANAPYSLSGYLFSSTQAQGDSASMSARSISAPGMQEISSRGSMEAQSTCSKRPRSNLPQYRSG